MEGMKLDVDRDVKLRLTFETAEGTLVIANLKCSVAAAPLPDGLGDLIVTQSVYDLDQLGGKDTPLMAAMTPLMAAMMVVETTIIVKKCRCIPRKNKHVFLK
ncbi:hypothetical protein DYB28_016092 [Aphanomyces astaci]|uniref:Uncharacterized protein n=1 Tax=Aphanomyces astaci TaxID=112090 RepID=A0A9X8E194_APHAT|nr:hypothetical protein DYB28_016092 [Aphanomyces astaci]